MIHRAMSLPINLIWALPSMFIFGMVLGGCASLTHGYSACFPDYSWGRICRASQRQLEKHCWPGRRMARNDEGEMLPVDRFVGCQGFYMDGDKDKVEIWVRDSCAGAMAIPHEHAHADGISDPDNAGYSW